MFELLQLYNYNGWLPLRKRAATSLETFALTNLIGSASSLLHLLCYDNSKAFGLKLLTRYLEARQTPSSCQQ
jgi:hypothetical protein